MKTWFVKDRRNKTTYKYVGDGITWETIRHIHEEEMKLPTGWMETNPNRYDIEESGVSPTITRLMPEIKLYGGRREYAESLWKMLEEYQGNNPKVLKMKSVDFQSLWKVWVKTLSDKTKAELIGLLVSEI